jgi:hypothetical protein
MAGLAACLLLPRGLWARLPDLCPFHRLLGRPCPACGLTRSWAALLHGDLPGAFRYHALGPAALGVLALLAALSLRRDWKVPGGAVWAWAGALLWAAYAAGRMGGWFPCPPAG